jgi:hypothetical protein
MTTFLTVITSVCLSSSLPTLKYRAVDNDGEPISGALMYFYEAGTTTPLATYSDEDLSVANANPVVADGNGWFEEIYLQTDEPYRVVLKSSDGATTYFTVDDINATQLTSSSLSLRLKQVASNPVDYGAVGDGVADETSYVQSAIDNATGVVDLLGKTYRVDNTLTLDVDNSGIIIKNGTLDFSNSSESAYIDIAGTSSGLASLTADASAGDLTISLNGVTGLDTGDFALLQSNVVWGGSAVTGEIVEVDSISGYNVTFREPIEEPYTVATSSYLSWYDIVDNIEFLNVTFIGNPSASGTGDMIKARTVSNLKITKCHFSGFKNYAINLYSIVVNAVIDNNRFVNSGTYGKSLFVRGSSSNVAYTNNTVSRVTNGCFFGFTGVNTYGQVRHSVANGNIFEGVTNAVRFEANSRHIGISDNDITCDTTGAGGSGSGIYVVGIDYKITGNKIRKAGGYGLTVLTNVSPTISDSRSLILSNVVNDPGSYGIYLQDTDSQSIEINSNTIHGSTTGIHIAGRTGDTMISNNIIRESSAHGINLSANDYINVVGNIIENASASTDSCIYSIGSSYTVISSNRLHSDGGYGINGVLTYSNIASNIITDAAEDGISLRANSSYTVVSSNYVFGTTASVYVDDTSNVTISGNLLREQIEIDGVNNRFSISSNTIYLVGNDASAIYANASSELNHATISGNLIYGVEDAAGYGINLVHGDDITITGNTIRRNDSTAPSINLAGDGAGAIDNVIISGNVFDNGSYVIGEATDANATNVYVGVNRLDNILTGYAQGTVTSDTSVGSGANTACSTTCGTDPCLAGFDTGASVFVTCSDATADTCLCHGG